MDTNIENEEDQSCERCGSDKDTFFGYDPYAWEIHGDTTEMWLCLDCYHISADEI